MFSFSQPTEAVISEFCSTVARWFILWTNGQARMVYALEKSDKRVLPHCWSLVHFVNKLTRADGVRAREGACLDMLFPRLPTGKRENQKKSHQTLRVAVTSAGRRFVLLPGFVLHQENQETQQKSRFSRPQQCSNRRRCKRVSKQARSVPFDTISVAGSWKATK
jgi:hypothetical protein